MRRMLISTVLVAAVLAAPCAALAVTGEPAITTPATSPVATATVPIVLIWSDVPDETRYHVFRGSPNCSTSVTEVSVGGLPSDTLTFSDTPPADGTYCYYVQAEDTLTSTTSDSPPVLITLDTTPPVITLAHTGGNGCSAPFTVTATATDISSVTFTLDAVNPYTPGTSYPPAGAPYESVNPTVIATDAFGHQSTQSFLGRVLDSTRPPAPDVQVTTEPAQQKATLAWQGIPPDGASVVSWHLHTKGPQGSGDSPLPVNTRNVTFSNLQVDATYEYTLSAIDECGEGATAIRLVRLNDTAPPTAPIVAGPTFNPATRVVDLTWVASNDNIQVDHYEILRNGVPIGATDAASFTDSAPSQHTALSYVVRAVDTNGNETDSAPALVQTPDWTPPAAPLLKATAQGMTVTLAWPAAGDNVGVVGYDVLRDDVQVASMSAAVRTYKDTAATGVKKGVHTWRVRARDAAGLSATSAPQSLKITKPVVKASLVSVHMVGGKKTRGGAARLSLGGRARLIVDLRIVGTVPNAKLRLYVRSGRGRITVWRGTPGSSATRLRLGSALARHGYVTVSLKRALHSGRVRLVLIASGHVVIAGNGSRKPKMKAG